MPDYLWLDLRQPSEFGSRIYFFPSIRLFHFFSRHPLVEELKIIVERGAALDSELAAQSAALAIRAIAVRTAAFLVFSGVLGAVVIGGVRSSDPYREAVAAVRDSASSRRLLGAPVNPGWYVTGYVEGVSSHGRAKLSFPVSGPRSEGTVRLSASRKRGVWVFSVLELQVEGRSIDLLRPRRMEPDHRNW